MKLRSLFFLSIFGLTACFRVASESAPVSTVEASKSPTPVKIERSAGKVVPILETNIGGLLGGAKNGEWIRAKEAAASLTGAGEYKFYDLESATMSELRGDAPTTEAPCEDFFGVTLDKEWEQANGVAFGSHVSWNPLARPLKKIDAQSTLYQKIIGEVLAGKNLTNATTKIEQIFQTDLDGDGTEEVVLSATFFKRGLSSKADVGDYSFVLLRKVINEKAENFVLAGDFVEKKTGAGVPAEYKISSIADLNGDGKMEIVVYARYYEGDWVEVFELKNNKPAEVVELKAACGS